jgi:hypothetical protein
MGVKRENAGKPAAHQIDMWAPAEQEEKPVQARVSFRSVFPVADGRLAIGSFNRPLLDDEARHLRSAWERSRLPGVEDFEVTPKQVSFVTPAGAVDATWRSIDRLLATPSLRKAS